MDTILVYRLIGNLETVFFLKKIEFRHNERQFQTKPQWFSIYNSKKRNMNKITDADSNVTYNSSLKLIIKIL